MSERERTLTALQSLREGAELRAGGALGRARAELARAEAELSRARETLLSHHAHGHTDEARHASTLAHTLQQGERHARGQALIAARLRSALERAERQHAEASQRARDAQRTLERRSAERTVVERRRSNAARELAHTRGPK